MAFRALLSSKNADTNTSMVAACKNAGIRVEVCTDIFAAIEKGKTQPYSCLIADWAEQPEASFLLRRARESAPNRETLAMAIVDREPTAAEVRENRLAFLIHRPIVRDEALAVLAQACEQMRPSGDEDEKELQEDAAVVEVPTVPVAPVQIEQTENYGDENFSDSDASVADGGDIRINAEQKSPSHHYGEKPWPQCCCSRQHFSCGDRSMLSSICRTHQKAGCTSYRNPWPRFCIIIRVRHP